MRLLPFAPIAVYALASVAAVAQSPAPSPAPAPTNASSGSSANSDDTRIRCRRIPMTGSHVRVERVCKTVAEWRRIGDRGNDVAREQAAGGNSCAGGACGNGG